MGYLVRLTEENGYETPSWIMRIAGLRHEQPGNSRIVFIPVASFESLAGLTNNRMSDIARLTYQPTGAPGRGNVVLFHGAPIHKYLLTMSTQRVCPDCLREVGYCRRVWDLRLVTTCPLHKRMLLGRCPKCCLRLPSKRSRVSFCPCGYDYRNADTRAVGEREVALAAMIHRFCGILPPPQTERRQNRLDEEGLSEVATLMVFFVCQLKGLLTTTGSRHIQSFGLEDMHAAQTEAYGIFDRFPLGYHEFLERCQRRHDVAREHTERGESGLTKSFGSFYKGISVKLRSPKYDFLRVAFYEYAARHWQGGYIAKGMRKIPTQQRSSPRYLSRSEARQQLGVGYEYLDHLVATEMLKTIVRRTGTKRMILFEAGALAEVKRVLDEALSAAGAAERLNVSSRIIGNLVSNGCLDTLYNAKTSGIKRWRILDSDVERLLHNIRGRIATPTTTTAGPKVFILHRAYRSRLVSKISVARFVADVIAGVIAPCGEDATKIGLSRFMFEASDVIAYLKLPPGENTSGHPSGKKTRAPKSAVFTKLIYSDPPLVQEHSECS